MSPRKLILTLFVYQRWDFFCEMQFSPWSTSTSFAQRERRSLQAPHIPMLQESQNAIKQGSDGDSKQLFWNIMTQELRPVSIRTSRLWVTHNVVTCFWENSLGRRVEKIISWKAPNDIMKGVSEGSSLASSSVNGTKDSFPVSKLGSSTPSLSHQKAALKLNQCGKSY